MTAPPAGRTQEKCDWQRGFGFDCQLPKGHEGLHLEKSDEQLYAERAERAATAGSETKSVLTGKEERPASAGNDSAVDVRTAREVPLQPDHSATAGSDETWPCQQCGKPRTQAEGGKIFTVCDDCWDTMRSVRVATPPVREAREPTCGIPLPKLHDSCHACDKCVDRIREIGVRMGQEDLAAKDAEIRSLREELEATQWKGNAACMEWSEENDKLKASLAAANDKAAALEGLVKLLEDVIRRAAGFILLCDAPSEVIDDLYKTMTALAPPNAAAREGEKHLAGCRCPECDPAYNDPRNDEATP